MLAFSLRGPISPVLRDVSPPKEKVGNRMQPIGALGNLREVFTVYCWEQRSLLPNNRGLGYRLQDTIR